jgi:hypothetical protein
MSLSSKMSAVAVRGRRGSEGKRERSERGSEKKCGRRGTDEKEGRNGGRKRIT